MPTVEVSTIIDQQRTAVTETMDQAQAYLDTLLDNSNQNLVSVPFNIDELLSDTQFYDDLPVKPNVIVDIPLADSARPTLDINIGTLPSEPVYDFSTIADITPPDFDTAMPAVSIPTPPSATLPNAPADVSFTVPDIPVAPAVNIPAVPTFNSLNLPTAPTISFGTFDAIVPNDDLVTPTAEFLFSEAVYESTLLDPLKAKILADLEDGGYGIETDDEEALFNRARDRAVEAMLSKVEDAGRAMAMRGFPLPPGELALHVNQAYQEMQDSVAATSRDITLERSRLYVENRRFTIEQARGVEQILLGFHNSVQERALNVARLTVEMSIAVYNTLVERYKARWQGYQAQATAFEARVRAELAKAEVYRTEVEAKSVEVQMQRQQVEVYLAQLKSITTAVDIYRVQMDAANIRASIERMRLEAYRAQIDAYSAQVQAKVAEFGLFRAQVEGEKAKVDVFDAQVRAFNGRVSAKKIEADVRLGRLQSETEQVRAKVALFQGQIAGYEVDARTKLTKGQLQTEVYRSDIEKNRLDISRAVSSAEIQGKAYDSVVRQNQVALNAAVESAKAKLQAAIASLQLRTETTKYGAEKFFALLTAMYGSINTLAVQSATE